MKNSDVNNVRQVLMNDLGLTRELIRKEAERIIEEAIKRHIVNIDNKIDKVIKENIEWALNKDNISFKRDTLEKRILVLARNKVDKILEKEMKITYDIKVSNKVR